MRHLKRFWREFWCNHKGHTKTIPFNDNQHILLCRNCGRVLRYKEEMPFFPLLPDAMNKNEDLLSALKEQDKKIMDQIREKVF